MLTEVIGTIADLLTIVATVVVLLPSRVDDASAG